MFNGFNALSALSIPDGLDEELVDVARKFPSHKFLGGATQGVYRSQIALLRDYAEKFCGDVASVRVLDWGAGKGHISYFLKKEGFQVTSCDLVSESIDSAFAQQTPLISANEIDIVPLNHEFNLPFESGSFDIVVSFGVLEHVDHDLQSLKEIRRILKPGGVMFFSFLPFWLSWTQRLAHIRGDRYHSRLYSVSRVKSLARQAGFTAGQIWHGQLFPKNGVPFNPGVEKLDRFLTKHTPLKYFATNLEGFLFAE